MNSITSPHHLSDAPEVQKIPSFDGKIKAFKVYLLTVLSYNHRTRVSYSKYNFGDYIFWRDIDENFSSSHHDI